MKKILEKLKFYTRNFSPLSKLILLLVFFYGSYKFVSSIKENKLVVFYVLIFMMSIVFHEVAHGFVAYLNGDNTAKNMGRLTLNPLKHVDIVGILLPLTLVFLGIPAIGWAKPVPVNYRNLKNGKISIFFVAIAGIATNLILAIIAALVYKILFTTSYFDRYLFEIREIASYVFSLNVLLASFNILPIPPLDGSKILTLFLNKKYEYKYLILEKYGFLIILILIWTNILNIILNPIHYFFVRIIKLITGV
ncbi:MAG: site-2 protease family protein [Fusobacteriaceae bacterium]|nr:site-2 protease family protein [Fusobacteriaceae bacterium]MBN2838567.1 site-2 protease family protein [Fusobacteriaceae bacterium]